MHQFKWLLRPELCSLREGRAPLLAGETCLAQLPCRFDRWQPTHHALAPHLLQGIEVDVAETLVPPPRRCVVACGEADAHHRTQGQLVQPVRRAPDLDDEVAAPIVDRERPVPDPYVAGELVQLAEAYDAAPKPRDVVDIREDAVLSSIDGEGNCSAPHDLNDGAVPKLDAAAHPLVQLHES